MPVPPSRHLLRAKDLADGRYAEPLTVADLAAAARLSPAHISRGFRRAWTEKVGFEVRSDVTVPE
ncbi:MAG: hypothetical protein ACJ72B_05845, partial [Ornithinibacter sp.]